MALKTPQEMQQTKLDATPGTRFQSSVAPKIDTGFIDILSKKATEEEALRVRKEKEKFTFLQTDFKNKADALRIDAQSEMTDHKGIKALQEEPNIVGKYQRALDNTISKYPSEVHPYLQQEAGQAMNRLRGATVPYVHGQTNEVKNNAYKTRLNNDINSTIENSGDLNFINEEGLANVEQSARLNLRRQYGDNSNLEVSPGVTAGTMIEEGTKKAVSSTLLGSVIQQSKVASVEKANEIFNRFSHEMTPADRVKAAEAIKTARDDKATKNSVILANMALREHADDPVSQELYVRANSVSDRDYAKTMAVLKSEAAAVKRAKDQTEEKTMGKIYDDLASGKGLDEADLLKIPADKRNNLVDEINFNGGGVAKETDWDIHDKVLDSMSSDRNLAKTINLSALRGKIDPKRLEVLQRIQSRAKQQDTDQSFKAQQGDPEMARDVYETYFQAKGVLSKKTKGEVKSFVHDRQEQILNQHPTWTPRQVRSQLKLDLYDRGTKTVKEPWRFTFGLINSTKIKANPDLAKSPVSTSDNSKIKAWYKAKFPNASESTINGYTEKYLQKKK